MELDLSRLQPSERAAFALRSVYQEAGCCQYRLGRFEEYSLYQANRSFLPAGQLVTFTDLDGRLLALKPDVTLSIAKSARPAPGQILRYYYHEKVCRPSEADRTFREIDQMGLELLGAAGPAQDGEPGEADHLLRLVNVNRVRHNVFCGRLEARFPGWVVKNTTRPS